ncbi:MAG: hypothetical protein AAFR03_13990 [Pseudomonadota bacterium]
MRDYRNEDELRRDEALTSQRFSTERKSWFGGRSKDATVRKPSSSSPDTSSLDTKDGNTPAPRPAEAVSEDSAVSPHSADARSSELRPSQLSFGPVLDDVIEDVRRAPGSNPDWLTRKAAVIDALTERAVGDRFAMTQAVRLWIALGWALAALALAGLSGSTGLSGSAGLSGNALVLLSLAGIGGGAALLAMGAAAMSGGFSGRSIEEASEDLGSAIVQEMSACRQALTVAGRTGGASAENAAEYATARHGLGALLKEAPFALSPSEDEKPHAQAAYVDFVDGGARLQGQPDNGAATGAVFVTLGVVAGAALMAGSLVFLGDPRVVDIDISGSGVGGSGSAPSWLSLETLVLVSIIVGGLSLYLSAGSIGGPLARALHKGARNRRMEASFEAVTQMASRGPSRSDLVEALTSYTPASYAPVSGITNTGYAAQAPRSAAPQLPAAGVPARSAHGEYQSSPVSTSPEATSSLRPSHRPSHRPAADPDWREEVDVNPRFVDTGFQAAPKSWRAEEKKRPRDNLFKRGS